MSLKKKSQYRTQDVPKDPGVYVFRDQFKQVIYVGKAKSLRKRLSNYFQPSRLKTADPKLRSLINSIAFFELHTVKSESESLLLETRFIKEYAPKYNILMRDDKRFLLIKIHLSAPYPKLSLTRLRKDDGAHYFGPFPKAGVLRDTLDFLTKYFRLRSCSPEVPDEKDFTHCHESVLASCSAPCNKSCTQEEYHSQVQELMTIFTGKVTNIIIDLTDEMKIHASAGRFEKAAIIRDIIENIKSLFKPQRNFSNSILKQKADASALLELKEKLKLENLPKVIECFDNSNFQGTNAVASMVQFRDGKPYSKNYRHFKIKTVEGIDDFASMREIVKRRYSRLIKEDLPLPDMILIDGGKGQLSSACKALEEIGLTGVDIFGLAKRYEILFRPNDSEGIFLDPDSHALKILQYLRDEAHRFAITFHRDLRNKRITNSILDDISGIGKKRKMQILKEFGSVKNLRTKSEEELIRRIPGIGSKMAETIFEHISRKKG
ncbi:MAG: excinuclease ABC subunit UvrC [Lentisphaeraceae bacterium]|nr:excinuclease ABC subunit UvrC [Lentisphaeraceae bacterium]